MFVFLRLQYIRKEEEQTVKEVSFTHSGKRAQPTQQEQVKKQWIFFSLSPSLLPLSLPLILSFENVSLFKLISEIFVLKTQRKACDME